MNWCLLVHARGAKPFLEPMLTNCTKSMRQRAAYLHRRCMWALVHEICCFHLAPSHFLNQCWLIKLNHWGKEPHICVVGVCQHWFIKYIVAICREPFLEPMLTNWGREPYICVVSVCQHWSMKYILEPMLTINYCHLILMNTKWKKQLH